MNYQQKLARLDAQIAHLGRVAVAFSGGVDSTALLHACRRVLGRDSVLAVTADSESLPRQELYDAIELASRIDARHRVVKTQELQNADYQKNGPDRCYFCKHELFTMMESLAESEGVDSLLYGAIVDDLFDFRPGARAAAEFQVVAPFQNSGFNKEDVREYSRSHGLPTASKASFACLSSRIPHGSKVTSEKLHQVEVGETALRGLGFQQYRVRHHGAVARVELGPTEVLVALRTHARSIVSALKAAGYERVVLDLRGYRGAGERAESANSFWHVFETEEFDGVSYIKTHAAEDFGKIESLIESGEFPSSSLGLELDELFLQKKDRDRSCSAIGS